MADNKNTKKLPRDKDDTVNKGISTDNKTTSGFSPFIGKGDVPKRLFKKNLKASKEKFLRFFKNYKRAAKKKPLLIIIPAAILVIIILVIILIASSAKPSGVEAGTEHAEIETLTHQKAERLDDVLWKYDGQYAYYDDKSYESIRGIDISEWTHDVDWKKVKSAGIDFVICRVGYRGYETGKFDLDGRLEEYLEGAEKAGIRTGAYFVTQAVSEEEAVEEAEIVLEKIKGFEVKMPLYIDCEANTGVETRTDDLSKEQHTKNALAFCNAIEDAGYRAGIYSNEEWINMYLDMDQLSDYDIWLAKYTEKPYSEITFNMWQYSATGSVPGISTDADLNVRIEKKSENVN